MIEIWLILNNRRYSTVNEVTLISDYNHRINTDVASAALQPHRLCVRYSLLFHSV